MCSLRRVLVPLVALVISLALPAGSHAFPADLPAGLDTSATDLDCCHHAANVPCGEVCPMGAGIASAVRLGIASHRSASLLAPAPASPRSWARAPVTAPPKHFIV